MTEDAGLSELRRIKVALEKPDGVRQKVVRLIRDAVVKNSLPDADTALVPDRDDKKPHPAVASARTAMDSLLCHIGRIAGMLNREHVLGIHDLFQEVGVHPGVTEMIGVHIYHLATEGKLKVSPEVEDFALMSYGVHESAHAVRIATRGMMDFRIEHPRALIPDSVREAEIGGLASAMQESDVHKHVMARLRKKRSIR